MARDLNRLMEDIRNSRQVYVTADGQVEDAREAQENVQREATGDSAPRNRTQLKPDIFGPNTDEVRVHYGVFDAMMLEARRYDIETGGIVVGPDDNTITELISSGPEAKRSASSYQLDVGYLQVLLDGAESRGLRFLGVWHVHPEGCPELSDTDQRSAKRMIHDPDYNVNRVLMPLTSRNNDTLETRFYVAEGPHAAIRRIENVTIFGSHREEPNGNIPVVSSSAAPRGRGTSEFHHRLAQDVQQLRSDNWTVSHKRVGEELGFQLVRQGQMFWMLFPPEYPCNPPDVFSKHGEELRSIPFSELTGGQSWSSRRTLNELLANAIGCQSTSNSTLPSVRMERSRHWLRFTRSLGRKVA